MTPVSPYASAQDLLFVSSTRLSWPSRSDSSVLQRPHASLTSDVPYPISRFVPKSHDASLASQSSLVNETALNTSSRVSIGVLRSGKNGSLPKSPTSMFIVGLS